MAASGWQDYLDISGIPDERRQELVQALDNMWATDSGQQIIREAFAANQNVKISITGADTGHESRNGSPISAGTRQHDRPGQAEVTFDFVPVTFEHEGQSHPMTLDRLLRHELHHIAHEQSELAEAMRPHLYSHIREAGGLKDVDIDRLQEMGVLTRDEVEAYKQTIGQGEYVGLATIEGDGHQLTTEQFHQFTEHVLAEETQAIRDLVGDIPITPRIVESLLRGGIDNRIGAIRVDQAKDILERLERGETITVSDLEEAVGPFSYVELSQYVAMEGAVATQLSEENQQRLLEQLGKLDSMVTTWNDAQRAHEEHTVDYVDATTEGPDRGEYGNFDMQTQGQGIELHEYPFSWQPPVK